MTWYATRLLLRGKRVAIGVLWLIAFLLGAVISITSAMLMGQHEIESVFDFNQLDDVGLFQMSPDLSPLSNELEVLPEWLEAWRRVEQLGGLGAAWMQYRFVDADLGDLLFTSAEMLDRIPLPLSQGTWPVWAYDQAGNIPIVLDWRLQGQYQMGDKISLSIDPYEDGERIAVSAIVHGFLSKNGGHVDLSRGRSELFELKTYVSANAEDMVAITLLPKEIMAYAVERGGCALLIPDSGNMDNDRVIRAWNEELSSNGIGDVLSMEKLYAYHEHLKRQWMPTFVAFAVNMILLLIIALTAFIDMLFYRERNCIGVFKMIGLNRRGWFAITITICFTLIWPVFIGSLVSRYVVLVYQTLSFAPTFLPIGLVLCALICTEGFLLHSWDQIEPNQLLKEAK